MRKLPIVTAAVAVLLLVMSGCGQPAQDAASVWQIVSEANLTKGQMAQQKKARRLPGPAVLAGLRTPANPFSLKPPVTTAFGS